jgi:hypothetical protein
MTSHGERSKVISERIPNLKGGQGNESLRWHEFSQLTSIFLPTLDPSAGHAKTRKFGQSLRTGRTRATSEEFATVKMFNVMADRKI